jgi:hypothetical protein
MLYLLFSDLYHSYRRLSSIVSSGKMVYVFGFGMFDEKRGEVWLLRSAWFKGQKGHQGHKGHEYRSR